MNIKRLSFSLIIVAALSLSAFAACGNGVPTQGTVEQPKQGASSPSDTTEAFQYVNETYGYTLELPEKIYTACEVREQGGEVYFSLENDGDMVMAVISVPDAEKKEENLGLTELGSSNGFTTYLQLPTCGTLNNESNRELWTELCEEARTIGNEQITFE